MLVTPLFQKGKRGAENEMKIRQGEAIESCLPLFRSIHKRQMSRVMRKPMFCICENKDADQLRGTAKLISAFVFAT